MIPFYFLLVSCTLLVYTLICKVVLAEYDLVLTQWEALASASRRKVSRIDSEKQKQKERGKRPVYSYIHGSGAMSGTAMG